MIQRKKILLVVNIYGYNSWGLQFSTDYRFIPVGGLAQLVERLLCKKTNTISNQIFNEITSFQSLEFTLFRGLAGQFAGQLTA